LTPLDRPRSFLEAGPSFCFCRGIIAPLDYYPAFLQTGAHHGLRGLRANVALAGQLACRSCLVCLGSSGIRLYCRVIDHDFAQWGHILGRLMAWASRPLKFFALLVALSAIAHLPMELAFNPLQWAAFGPFTFQTSRILHYLVYFLIVAGVGAYGINRFVLAPDGKLARRWPLWLPPVLACLRCLQHSFLSPLRTVRVRA
jgi:hypothetical protein